MKKYAILFLSMFLILSMVQGEVSIISSPSPSQTPTATPSPIIKTLSTEEALNEIFIGIKENNAEILGKYRSLLDGFYYFVELEGISVSEYYLNLKKTGESESSAGEKSKAYKNQKLIPLHNQIKTEILKINKNIVFDNDLYIAKNGLFINVRTLGPDDLNKIRALPFVTEIFADSILYLFLNDAAQIIGAGDVWKEDILGGECIKSGKECLTGKGVKVAVIDTGVDYTHSDFADELGICTKERFEKRECKKIVDGYDFANKDNDPMDGVGHGTHVAGIIAANGIVKGIAPEAQIYAYKTIIDDSENVDTYSFNLDTFSIVVKAIEKASDLNADGDPSDHVDIISISMGTYESNEFMRGVTSNIINMGIVLVVAMGNAGFSGTFSTGAPANIEDVIGVGASCKPDQISNLKDRFGNKGCDNGVFNGGIEGHHASFSSNGPTSFGTLKPDMLAPGVLICSTKLGQVGGASQLEKYPTCIDDIHVTLSGTSMAAPVVSGAAALLKQKHPDWGHFQIKYSLKGTAQDMGLARVYQGDGQIDIKKATELQSSYPRATLYRLDDLFVSGVVIIKGVAISYPREDFKSYILEYSEGFDNGDDELVWKIISSSNGLQEGILGQFDTSIIGGSVFTIRLRVIDKYGRESIDEMVLFKKPASWKEKWPVKVASSPLHHITPSFGDINGDGKNEIVVGIASLSDSNVYVLDIDGNLLWKKQLPPGLGSTPALGDINGDGKLDIVYAGMPFLTSRYYIYAWNYRGENIFDPIENIGFLSYSMIGPSLSDVDGDKKEEILVSLPHDSKDLIYRGDRSELTGPWNNIPPKSRGVFPNFYAIDINNNGKKEIFLLKQNAFYIWDNAGRLINRYFFDPGNTKGFENNLLFGNIDNDPFMEIILTLNNYNKLIILDGEKFSIEYEIEIPSTKYLINPILADINNDGKAEIYFEEIFEGGQFFVVSYEEGDLRVKSLSGISSKMDLALKASNIDGDLNMEIIFTQSDKLGMKYLKNGVIGEKIEGLDFYPEFSHIPFYWPEMTGFTVSDIDKDGNNDFLSTLYSGNMQVEGNLIRGLLAYINGYVILEHLDAPVMGGQWGIFRHDVKESNSIWPENVLRGDANGDGKVQLSDAIFILEYLFQNKGKINCIYGADANGDRNVDLSDAIKILFFLFEGGRLPEPVRGGCLCNEGEIGACSSNIGECKIGTHTCANGVWGSCEEAILPSEEMCDGKDNDCDGEIDEFCKCNDGAIKLCGSSIGECREGKQTCINSEWGSCEEAILPSEEMCDGKDNDCDGEIDENNAACGRDKPYCASDLKICVNCIDSDVTSEYPGGNNPYIKGTIQYSSSKVMEINADICANVEDLVEYACSPQKDRLEVLSYKCQNGCKSGACIK